jgi:large subunit ribosomal protein L31
MKTDIHPEYVVAHVRCTCGNEFYTRATRAEYSLEICSECHPFYTGRQKLIDTGGRVERFQRRAALGRAGKAAAGKAKAERAASDAPAKPSRTSAQRGESASEQAAPEAPTAESAPEQAAPEAPTADHATDEHSAAAEAGAVTDGHAAVAAEDSPAAPEGDGGAPEANVTVVEVSENGAADGGASEPEGPQAHSNGAGAEQATTSD